MLERTITLSELQKTIFLWKNILIEIFYKIYPKVAPAARTNAEYFLVKKKLISPFSFQIFLRLTKFSGNDGPIFHFHGTPCLQVIIMSKYLSRFSDSFSQNLKSVKTILFFWKFISLFGTWQRCLFWHLFGDVLTAKIQEILQQKIVWLCNSRGTSFPTRCTLFTFYVTESFFLSTGIRILNTRFSS